MAKAAQPRFVLPRACITPQGMPTEAHEVYRLREVRRLTYKAIGYLLHRSSNGGLITLLRAATALLQAQEAVLGAEAYGVLLAGVHGGVAQLGESLQCVQVSPPMHNANILGFQQHHR